MKEAKISVFPEATDLSKLLSPEGSRSASSKTQAGDATWPPAILTMGWGLSKHGHSTSQKLQTSTSRAAQNAGGKVFPGTQESNLTRLLAATLETLALSPDGNNFQRWSVAGPRELD